jgi:deoxycytidylate deaminase
VSREDLRPQIARLRAADLLAHVERRGWVRTPHPSPDLWLLAHPEHPLRQLLFPKTESDISFVDAVLDVVWRLSDIERVPEEHVLLELMKPAHPTSEHDALAAAVLVAQSSPCAKSRRGVVIFTRQDGVLARGWNAPPSPFRCDGSEACQASCNKIAVHAETAALHDLMRIGVGGRGPLEMLHVKVVNGVAVASGAPSCWQCSREVLVSGVRWFWLLHAEGLRRYTAEDFHTITLRNSSLPVIR